MYTIHILFVFASLFVLFFISRTSKNHGIFLLMVSVLLILCRTLIVWNTWDDLPYYAEEYNSCCQVSFAKLVSGGISLGYGGSEKGWIMYCWILSRISSNFYFLLFITGIIVTIAYSLTIKRYLQSSFYLLAVILYFIGPFTQSIFVLRQHLAIAIVLFGYPYIIKRRFLPSFLIMLIAFSVHISAVIVFPLIVFYHIHNNKYLLLLLLAYCLIIFIYRQYAIDFASLNIRHMDAYLEVEKESTTNAKNALLLTGLLMIRLYVLKNSFLLSGITRLCSVILVLAVINSFAGIGVGTFMGRLNMYFSEITFLVVPETLSYMKNKHMRSLFSVGYVCFLMYFFIKNSFQYNQAYYSLFIW